MAGRWRQPLDDRAGENQRDQGSDGAAEKAERKVAARDVQLGEDVGDARVPVPHDDRVHEEHRHDQPWRGGDAA